MSNQPRKTSRFISALSSPFRALKSRPPTPNSTTEAGSSSSAMPSRATPESLARNFPSINDSQTVDDSPNQQHDKNTLNPQRAIAMFSDIERINIGVGNFTQIINDRDDNTLKHLGFHLPRSRDAAFCAAINLDNLSRGPCTKGTRVDIIAQIMAWINEKDPAKAPPVYWLTGLAGLGKTTIAYTICELLNESHLPFISFFCSRQLDSRNSKLLVTTLCRDLAELYTSYATEVLSILEKNSKVVDAGLRIQIDELLAKPWQTSVGQYRDLPTPIIVVDALDESDRGSEFLEQLLRVINANQLAGIKFLVTSRPDPKIVDLCKSFPPNLVCKLHEVDTVNVQNDIEKYLQEALPELKGEPELALLSQRAGGLFIYATTAVRFISPLHTPRSSSEMRFHLQAMLNPGPLTSYGASDERLLVDQLYSQILGAAFRDAGVRSTRLKILHTIVCVESRIDVSVLADLIHTDQDTVKRVVESLHAVLYVSSKDGCVYWYHASFPDFLFSQTRARIGISGYRNHPTHEFSVFCDAPAHHGVIARRCFSIMQKSLHFNMCNLPSSYILDSEAPGLDASIAKTFPLTLRYVARHWARHLLRAVPAENDTDELFCGLKDFLDKKLLFWMEAMNLIGAKFECSSLLKDAESWLEKGKECPDVLHQLADATNFSAFFAGSPASKSTPHLYISALSMWNQDSMIWRDWSERFMFIPSILLPRDGIAIPLLTISTTDYVTCIAFSPDGNQIVSGSEDDSVQVWDAKTGEQLRRLQGHAEFVTSVAFLPDGNQIASSSWDGSVRVWDAMTGEQLRELSGRDEEFVAVAFSADGNQIVSCSCDDESVRVWDVKTGNQVELHGHADDSVAFSHDGSRIVFGIEDGSVWVWDTKTGEQLMELQGYTERVGSFAFSPDGNQIVSGSESGSVRVWDANTGERRMELQGHTDSVCSIAFSYDSKRLVSGSMDKLVRVRDARTGELLRELQGHTGGVTSVAFSRDSNRIVSGSYDMSVRVWDAKVGAQRKGGELRGHTDSISEIAFSPDGNRIVSGSYDMSVRVWDAKTGEQLRVLEGHTWDVSSVAFSPDGNQIVSGSWDKSVRVWDAKTGEQLVNMQGDTQVTSVAFSSDGNRIVAGYKNSSAQVWDLRTSKKLMDLQGHTSFVTSVAFSPDCSRIVSGSWDKSVRMWDVKTGKQLRVLEGHTDFVSSVAFSPDDNQIVSGSWDNSVWVWDAKTGEQLKVLEGHTEGVSSVAFSPDGSRIVSGSFDKSVRVWDAKTGELLRVLEGHASGVTSVAFSPDGSHIVSGSADCSVRVWANLDFEPPWVMQEDGWILSGADRLVWVPSSICNILLRPHNEFIISRNGYARISFQQCKLGPSWHECYVGKE